MDVDLKSADGCKRHEAAIHRIIDACRKTGKVPGIASPGPENQWLEAGCLFVTVGSDSGCIGKGASATLRSFDAYRADRKPAS